jgi:hypothetical protein
MAKRKHTPEPKPGFLYFIQVGDETGPIKIGHSANVEDRLRSLQTGNPYPVRLLGHFKFETPEAAANFEQRLQLEVFWDLRIRGEWFHCDPRILRLIRSMQMIEASAKADGSERPMRIRSINDDGEDFR